MTRTFSALMALIFLASSSFAQVSSNGKDFLAEKAAKTKELKAEISSVQLQVKAYRIGRGAAATVLVPLTVVAVVMTGIGIKESFTGAGGEERELGKGLAFIGGAATVVVGGITYAVLKLTSGQISELESRLETVKKQLDDEEAAIKELQSL
jgi:hypothetical protein